MFEANNLFALIVIRIKNWGAYRFDFFASVFGMVLPILGLSLYWLDTMKYSAVDNFLFTPKTIILYYIIVYAIEMVFSFELAFSVEEDIETGRMNSSLMLPCNYLTIKLAEFLSANLLPFCILFALIIVISLSSMISTSLITVLVFLSLFILGMLFHFLFMMILGLLTVWFKNVNGMLYFLQTITGLLAGAVIPLSLLPERFAWLVWNPFSLSIYIPSETLLTGAIDFSAPVVLSLWCIAIYILYRITWANAMRSYQAYGG